MTVDLRADIYPAAIGALDTTASVVASTGATTIVTGVVIAAVVVPMAWTSSVRYCRRAHGRRVGPDTGEHLRDLRRHDLADV